MTAVDNLQTWSPANQALYIAGGGETRERDVHKIGGQVALFITPSLLM